MKKKTDLALLAALLVVAIVWGTTYLAIRIAVHSIPPWFVAAMRQFIAAFILLGILWKNGQLKWIGWTSFKRQFLLAMLMIVIANGMTTVAEQHISSGLTSLLNAVSPIIVFVASVFVGLQKPTWKGFAGVLIGFTGVAFIFRDGFAELLDPHYRTGILCLSVAISGWAAGTIYTKMYNTKSENIMLDLLYQFSFAAVVQLLLAFIFSPTIQVSDWTMEGWMAVVYLAVFGSVLGYYSYNYALKRVSATEVSILSYFNTVIAIALGWFILDEVVTVDLLIATALIILGVFITNYKTKSAA